MKYKNLIYFLLAIVSFMAIMNSCKKEDKEESSPELITLEVSQITNISAYSGAEIKVKGKYEIIRQGLCWSTKPNPTIADFHVKDESDSDAFSMKITDLIPNTKYYLRAYATNYISTGYGNEIEFQTTGEKPVLSTNQVTVKTYQSIECGGNIVSDGGDVIEAKGVCWSENPEPSITDNKSVADQGTGLFTSNVTNLKPNTKYYIRAYATNSVGTTYGDIKSFTLWLNVPDEPIKDIDGNTYRTIRIGNQVWMQENLKVTKFQNGTGLKSLNNQSNWTDKSSPGYYTNVDQASFGYIYNGFAISDNQNISPSGWHVPSESEWNTLISYLGGSPVAGGKLKESSEWYWAQPNAGADNTSGFTALPNGYVGADGASYDKLQDACFMLATFDSSGNPAFGTIENTSASAFITRTSAKISGASIRCVKN